MIINTTKVSEERDSCDAVSHYHCLMIIKFCLFNCMEHDG